MGKPFQIAVKDWTLAQEIQNSVEIGHRFVFVHDGKALQRGGRLGRLFGYRAKSHRSVVPMLEAPVELAGVEIEPIAERIRPLACLVADRDLYRREQDTVRLFAAMLKPTQEIRLAIRLGGAPFSERALSFGADGVAIEALSTLLAGRYEAQLLDAAGPLGAAVSFTVADYSLAPLSARLAAHQVHRAQNLLSFDLGVESYQVPFAQTITAALVEGEHEVARIDLEPTVPGRYSGKVALAGEGPFRLRLTSRDDAALVADVVIPGSRRHERDVTRISELGRELFFSLMPEPGALPVRGGFLTEGDHIATPLTVDDVIGENGIIRVNTPVEALTLAIADLASGEFQVIEPGDIAAGAAIEVPLPGPMATVFAGCFIDGHPFEGFTSFIRRPKLELTIDAPAAARPGDAIEIRLRSNGSSEARCLVSVRDERLTAVDTPNTALAASAKRTFSTLTSMMDDEVAFRPLAAEIDLGVAPSAKRGGFFPFGASPSADMDSAPTASPERMLADRMREPPPRRAAGAGMEPLRARAPKAEAAPPGLSRSVKRRDSGPPPQILEEIASYAGAFEELEAGPEVTTGDLVPARGEAPQVRAVFPEVLFYGLVPVAGEETLVVPLKDSLATYSIEVFAIADGDWTEAKTTVTVDQPVRADLDLPAAVAHDDRVLGRIRAAASSGELTVRVACSGEPIELFRGGKPIGSGEVLASPIELEFFVRPGTWIAEVTDARSSEKDRAEAFVGTPGKFKSYVRQLALIERGQRITLDSEDAVALRVLPALDEPFALLADATAGYEHHCCEQTGAKILAAACMYLSAKTPAKRSLAEQIILAGVAREKTMWLRGRGFSPYPGQSSIAEYYGPKVVRYLWSLHEIAPLKEVSPALRRGTREALEMADDVARAIRMTRVPAKITSFEDAYAVAASKNASRCAEVRAFVEEQIDLGRGELRKDANADPVSCRLRLAYGAACLLAIGEVSSAIKIANKVTRQFNESGRLYSTLDSVAAICLMVQLEAAGIVSGTGRVSVNGRSMGIIEAAASVDQIEELAVLDGVALVEVTRVREEDWTSYSNELGVVIGFRDRNDRKVTRFSPGDRVELIVQLGKGYKFGDLVHVSLPASMAWIHGGGRVKRFSADFAGSDELRLPIVVTGRIQGKEHFAVCVRNMFEEARVTSPGALSVSAA
jgi:hypothetical protein